MSITQGGIINVSNVTTVVTQTKKLINQSAGAIYNIGNQLIPAWQFTHTGTGAKTRIQVDCTGYSGGAPGVGFSLLRNDIVVASITSGQANVLHAFVGSMNYISDSDTGTNVYKIRTNGVTTADVNDYCNVVITEYFDVVSSSAWISSTVPITATITNPTKGTPSKDVLRYRKVGDKTYQVQGSYQQAAGGTDGNGIYLYTLPGGLQFETAQIKSTNANAGAMAASSYAAKINGGTGSIWSGGGTAQVSLIAYDATRFYLATWVGSGGANYGFIQAHTYFRLGLDIFIEFDFTFTATT
jgi:hypothetical protein